MSKPIQVAIIGCGVIAPTHVQCYQKHADVQVRWACDLVPAKAQALADKYQIPRVSTRLAEVLADAELDAISICTDHASHPEIAEAALAAGKHVLCEKALAANSTGLARLLAAGRRYPKPVFGAVFQHRYDPVNQYLKKLVEDQVFGKLLTVGMTMRCFRGKGYYDADAWRGTWAQEGGAVLINQAIHFVDLLVWIGGGVESLTAMHANLTHADCMETEDTVMASLKMKNGALGSIEATCSSHLGWEPSLHFHGSTGSLEMRHDKPVKVKFTDAKLQEKVLAELQSLKDNPGVDAGKSYYGTGHPAQVADFVDAIRQGRQPFVTPESAAHTVAVVLGVYQSHAQQAWVKL